MSDYLILVNLERWCRLRGNLLFYFKTKEPWSEPLGVVVLEQCQVRIDPPMASAPLTNDGHFPFYLGEDERVGTYEPWTDFDFVIVLVRTVFDGGLCQALASTTEYERSSWMEAIRSASYEGVRAELNALRQCIERRRNHKPNVDLQTWRLQQGQTLGEQRPPVRKN